MYFVIVKNTIKYLTNNKAKNIESLFKIVLFLQRENYKVFRF